MDCVPAARKAAQAAALAATEHSQNNKAYEKLSAPSFPKSGGMANWVYSLGTATVVSGCFGDELEVKWLRECWRKAFDELEFSDTVVFMIKSDGKGLISLYPERCRE